MNIVEEGFVLNRRPLPRCRMTNEDDDEVGRWNLDGSRGGDRRFQWGRRRPGRCGTGEAPSAIAGGSESSEARDTEREEKLKEERLSLADMRVPSLAPCAVQLSASCSVSSSCGRAWFRCLS